MKPHKSERYRIVSPDFVGTALFTGRQRKHEGVQVFEFCDPNPDANQPETENPWTEATKLFTDACIRPRPFVGTPMNNRKIRIGTEIEWVSSSESRHYGFVGEILLFVIRKTPQASRIKTPFWVHNLLHDMSTECSSVEDGKKKAGEEILPIAGKSMIPFYWKRERAFDESPKKQSK